jgi:hypothetical protein
MYQMFEDSHGDLWVTYNLRRPRTWSLSFEEGRTKLLSLLSGGRFSGEEISLCCRRQAGESLVRVL